MQINNTISDMDARLKAAGVSASEVCRRAEVARSTWTRWKSGEVAPNTATLTKVAEVAERLIASAQEAKACR